LPGIELDVFLGELARHEVGQREIHVVAADQQMFADRQARKRQLASLLGHAYERQVGRAAAHIAHQQRLAHLQEPPPPLAHRRQPGIHGRLRLFEQDQPRRQSSRQGRFARQFTGRRVERRGHGQHHLLLGDRRLRMCVLPGGD
jgi:hypothetical protein